MYSSSYNKLFWGMIFLIFNFNLGCINIFPDFIGYLLFYYALEKLSHQNNIYEKGKMPLAVLLIFSLIEIFNNLANDSMFSGIENISLISMIIGSIANIINIYLIYIICSGIYEVCKEKKLINIHKETKSTWEVYFVLSLINLFYMPFSLNLTSDFNYIIMMLMAVLKIIVCIAIAFIFRRCSKAFSEWG